MFQLSFNEETKQLLMQSLDILARKIGEDLSKVGGQAAGEAAMKLISVHNAAAAVSQAPEAPETPTEPKALPPGV